MRRIGALLMGGFFPMVAALANCGGPEAPGPQIDGLQACIQACQLWRQLCAIPDDGWCADDCAKWLKNNAGEVCRDEYDAFYRCQLKAHQAFAAADPLVCPEWYQCDNPYYCYQHRGCMQLPAGCQDTDTLPCSCGELCGGIRYDSQCQADGMTSVTCDCFVAEMLVGSCQTTAEAACVNHHFGHCCDQFFMLEF